ncbi:hypothetical protein [Mycolicibacterium sp. J2]|uniref:hypothetical protein n=1 Tax=Mycolicibacterium sp. J2 TaxID=2993511 RepID=UPI00224AB1F9|nr:hypothetical protein [Mycolicibacterium sp. J2]MCX2715532.1 hypothetical protein [Mycolicibacterium sp. J2]
MADGLDVDPAGLRVGAASLRRTEPQREFAVETLRNLLHRIDFENGSVGRHTFVVSHAWTDGPHIFLVYTAPPSNVTWGLVRDTRESIVDGDAWSDVNEAALYYYLLDLEENWPGNFSRQPGDSDDIRWMGDSHQNLPPNPGALSDAWCVGSPQFSPPERSSGGAAAEPSEPRRYADPY